MESLILAQKEKSVSEVNNNYFENVICKMRCTPDTPLPSPFHASLHPINAIAKS